MFITNNHTSKSIAFAMSIALLSACSSRDEEPLDDMPGDMPNDMPNDMPDNPPAVGSPDSTSLAFVSTRAADYTAGQIEVLSLSDGNTLNGRYPATGSDIRVSTDGSGVYQIGRFQIDSITRFDPTDTSVFDYQISVNGDDSNTANPYDLAFIDDNKAYLTRRNGTKLWVVDPTPDNTPATVQDFLTSEIDLGAYATGAGSELDPPDMTDAIIVDDKLFVLMENLTKDGFSQVPDQRAYLAVFDTRDDQEINTLKSGNNLNAIQLLTVNPTGLQYNPTTGLIYVVGRGNFFESDKAPGDFYTGGIESIDPTTFNHTLLLDDGTNENNKGFFSDAIVISDTLGYMITLDGYDASSNSISNLRTFNLSTGDISAPLEGTAGKDLTTLAVGPDGHLWVGLNGNQPGFIRVNIANGEVLAQRVSTQLVPSSIVFLNTTTP